MRMISAIPALPVRNIKHSIDFYCDKFGFTLGYHEEGFAVLLFNEVRLIHLWEASDESWQSRYNSKPIISGAESFIAGTASCRIEVEDIDELYRRIQPLGILHPNAQLRDQWWGVREFGITDPDNNLIEFFENTNGSKRQK
ncbi:bleomycin resistance protein [Rossellomorea sp. BNER]|uniref:bleomycin resistance protein n=1 Tax=Rossellomorea sp. BNER TaxID=2962031 RepID=UPI003AF310C3|nr:VOC family protein [Rossellomorea sp. BNER]